MDQVSSSTDCIHPRDVYLCENCGMEFTDWSDNYLHRQETKHIVTSSDEVEPVDYCEECEEWFMTWDEWALHKRTCKENYPPGNYPFQCPACHRCYETDDELQEHFNDPAYIDWCREAEY